MCCYVMWSVQILSNICSSIIVVFYITWDFRRGVTASLGGFGPHRLYCGTDPGIKNPKLLTIGEYIKRFILKKQIDTGSAHNTKFQALFQ